MDSLQSKHPGPSRLRHASWRRLILALWLILAVSCSNAPAVGSSPTAAPEISSTPALAASTLEAPGITPSSTLAKPSSTPSPAIDLPTATEPAPVTLWLSPEMPAGLRQVIALPAGWSEAAAPNQATLRLQTGGTHPVGYWVYALVAPFPTVLDGLTFDELRRHWSGNFSGPFGSAPLLLEDATLQLLTQVWGAPAENAVQVLPANQLLSYAWDHRPAWAIVPFDTLEPRWKVLRVDGRSPLDKAFAPESDPLTIPFSLYDAGQNKLDQIPADWVTPPASNRDPSKLTTLVMTGVTALVRCTAWTMDQEGILYPAQDVGAWLREADVTHISNEVPFYEQCPLPDCNQEGMVFCSNPNYIQLLEDVGTDVVELTGDHFWNYGDEAMLYTIDMYIQRKWGYYGGGINAADASRALLVEHHGNKLAFIGCNAKGGGYATADEDSPGAVACDYEWMHQEIQRLTTEGYLAIVTFQHMEYYQYMVLPQYRPDFTGMTGAGAIIVQGSQAHQPQGMEFDAGGFIHYGMGNLFFDQYHYFPEWNADRAFIDRHVFYNGRHISTELLTIQFVDFALPRPMTPEERAEFLEVIFKASGW